MNPTSNIPTSNPPIPAEWLDALRNDTDGRAHRAFLGTAEQFPIMLQCARPECSDGMPWATVWRAFDRTKAGNIKWYLEQGVSWWQMLSMGAARTTGPSVSNFMLAALDSNMPALIELLFERASAGNELTDLPAWIVISIAEYMFREPLAFDACVPGNDIFIQQIFLSRLEEVGCDEDGNTDQNTTGITLGRYFDRHERFALFSRFADSRLRLDVDDATELFASASILGLTYPRAMAGWSCFFSSRFPIERLVESWPAEVRSFYQTAMALHEDTQLAVASAWEGYRMASSPESLSALSL
jgi:hypothetical protein